MKTQTTEGATTAPVKERPILFIGPEVPAREGHVEGQLTRRT